VNSHAASNQILSSALAAPFAAASHPVITGSFFDLIHVNSWDAAYWTPGAIGGRRTGVP
jgi:hypothetical protein